jgi:carbonic anhydrase
MDTKRFTRTSTGVVMIVSVAALLQSFASEPDSVVEAISGDGLDAEIGGMDVMWAQVAPERATEGSRTAAARNRRAEGDEETMSAIDRVVEANRRYAEGFGHGGLPGRPPALRLAVLSCLDCRLHVAKLLGLEPGDAHIMRNAGGVVTEDVLRSLIVAYHIGGDREFMIINNTKCGMLTFKDEELAARLQRETGKTPVVPARFLAFTDLEENVREQIRKARSHPWIPDGLAVRGFIYDVDTGRLTEVSP